MTRKDIETPETFLNEQVIKQLFPEIEDKAKTENEVADENKEENSIDFSTADVTTKFPELAVRALLFFQAQGIAVTPLAKAEHITRYRKLLDGWSKPWRFTFLTTAFDRAELQIIWEKEVLVQGNTEKEVANQQRAAQERLARVSPSVEITDIDRKHHYFSEVEIQEAIHSGKLQRVQMTNVDLEDSLYTHPELVTILRDVVDPKLHMVTGILRSSEAVRSQDYQLVLRKLAYPAAEASFHTYRKGGAIDFKLTTTTSGNFATFLAEENRLARMTELFNRGIQPTIENLITHKILDNTHPIAQAYLAIKDSVTGLSVDVIDETPFFSAFNKDNTIKGINPTFHVQYRKM